MGGLGAEIGNLTRNVQVEGTGDGSSSNATNGRAHFMMMSSEPQTIRHAAFRLLGPRQDTGKTYRSGSERVSIFEGVPGRYPVHFHMMGDAARGSLVEGVVVEQAGNHAIVPHGSHGVTVRDVVAYDVWEDAMWWDPNTNDGGRIHDSHDSLWDRILVAVVRDDPPHRGYRLAAYRLGAGEPNSNVLRDSVAAGVQGSKNASGYLWPEHSQGIWQFFGNVAHNNKVDGIFVWQNNSNPHVITDYIGYSNGGAGIDHGAYRNGYTYEDVLLERNSIGVRHLANAVADGQVWEGLTTSEDVRLLHHNLPGEGEVVYTDLVLVGDAVVRVDESGDPGTFVFRSTASEFDLTLADFEVLNCISEVRIVTADGAVTDVC